MSLYKCLFVDESLNVDMAKAAEHEGTFCREMSQRDVAATKSCDVHTRGIQLNPVNTDTTGTRQSVRINLCPYLAG